MRLVRKLAREHKLMVQPLTKPQGGSRGKGSHSLHALVDPSGQEVARFGLTDHPRDLSWTVLTRLEERLTPIFGERWTEKR